MKRLLAIIGGSVAALGLYSSGFVTALFYLSAEPTPVWKPSRDAAGVWTNEPVVVNPADQGFDRLPPRAVAERPGVADGAAIAAEAEGGTGEARPVDATRTASVADDGIEEPAPDTAPAIDVAHVQWCADRYRSYRVEDNGYTPYRGPRRECVSPYSDGSMTSAEEGAYAEANIAAERIDALSWQHVQSCLARYRSYRPGDNTYQPYGGGPRRQCE